MGEVAIKNIRPKHWPFILLISFLILSGTARAQFTANFQTNTISGVSNWVSSVGYVVGSNTFSDVLLVQSGGALSNGTGYIGYLASASNNTAIVTGAGSVWSNRFDLNVGYFGASNQLVIANGGAVYDANGLLGGITSSSNNVALVTGTGSVWSNSGNLYVGNFGPGNQLIITNGVVVYDTDGFVGFFDSSSNNSVRVADNATWRNSGVLRIGVIASSNTLTIAGGSVTASNAFIGAGGIVSNNILRVDSGSLFVTNALGTGALVVSLAGGPASLILNGGSVTADSLIATNGFSSVVTFNGGTLHVKGTVFANGQEFVVGDGASAATLDLLGGVYSFGTDLRIANAASLTGHGTIDAFPLIDDGSIFVSNGVWQARQVVVGDLAGSQGAFTIAGGTNQVTLSTSAPIVVGNAGNATGSIWVTGGQLVATNGAAFSTRVGQSGVGQMTVSNGDVRLTRLILGFNAGSSGTLTMAGGTNLLTGTLNALILGSSANATGTVRVTGGQLVVTNGTMVIGNNGVGQVTQSGGTMLLDEMLVGFAGSQGTLTVAGGTSILSDLSIGTSFNATGTVWVTSGQLVVTNGHTYIGQVSVGRMTVSNGTWLARNVLVGANVPTAGQGTLTIAGGESNIYSNLTVGTLDCITTGAVIVAGGSLFVTNATGNDVLEVRGGTFTLNAGTVRVDKFMMTNACATFIRTGGTLIYSTAVLSSNRDDDADGILNGYEQSHSLDPLNAADANLDSDGDGFTNLQEFQAGTDATNNASAFRITAIVKTNIDILVTWQTGSGRTNALERTAGVAGSFATNAFTAIFTVTNTVGSVTNYLDVGAATNMPSLYYRVRLVP